MELTVLLGDDDLAIRTRRSELLADAQEVERLDLAADGARILLDAVGAPSLFGGRRYVFAEGIETLTEADVQVLEGIAGTSDAVVVARGGTLAPKVREGLKRIGTVTTHTTPKGKGIGIRVDEMIDTSGITIRGAERRILVERAGHDLDRLNSVLQQLQLAGITAPSRAQLEMLLGSSAASGVPWDLTDALEDGRIRDALEAVAGLEAVPTVAYLASRTMQAGRLVDAQVTDTAAAQDLLGLSHRFQAEKVLRLARRLGPEGVRRSWDLLTAADRDVKLSPESSHVLTVLVLKLAELYRRS